MLTIALILTPLILAALFAYAIVRGGTMKPTPHVPEDWDGGGRGDGMTAYTNESWPGPLPVGTEVEVVRESGSSVVVRVGKRDIKVSPKWIDFAATEPRVDRSVGG
jgi:hypothetical protein